MNMAVICDDRQKEELVAAGILPGTGISWQEKPVFVENTEVYIDLLFSFSVERIGQLKNLPGSFIVVNAVVNTLHEFPENFIRINGWNSFLKNELIEGSAPENLQAIAEKSFSCFNKKIKWVEDLKGFITPRIISMIINEAYFALEENISSKEEINTAMKLGTNYPYGPFEWADKIGLDKIFHLLKDLSAENIRYMPGRLLEQEALSL